ncbi:MAG TPA: hypothetical protein VL092_05245 [Chitinophagaceae bacterium]|nr:hypothetical protein [Chitinophagaceae bacterium]
MWELLTEENRNKIIVGAIVMRYPLIGPPEEFVPDDYEEDQGVEYLIHGVDPEIHHITLTPPSLVNGNTAGKDLNPVLILNKYYEDIVEGLNWWIFEQN